MAISLDALASAINEQLAGTYTQYRRVLRLTAPPGAEGLLAESLRGEEQVDAGFRFELSALSLDAAIPLKALIGQPMSVELQSAGMMQPRMFHGHVTRAEQVGANGGFARYRLTLEPWTSFLGLGRDSRVFQDLTVFDILDAVFQSYSGKGRLAPAWRFDIRDRNVYPRRSLVTQYQESDLAFAERLMSEEGLFYFFEHEGSADSPDLGRHTLVVADHNDAFVPNPQTEVRFTQPGAVMKEDSLDRWRREMRVQTNTVELVSWDYRSRMQRTVTSGAYESDALVSRDTPGAYAFSSTEQGQRIADNQLQGLQARREVFTGAGTVRTMAPGTTFTLHEHASHNGGEADRFAILRVVHLAHNNLNAETDKALRGLLGLNLLQQESDAELATSLHATGRGAGERPVYRNRIDAIRSSVPYRPSRTDGQGQLLHPRPSVQGQQTAIVVGPPGSVIHTDRDHRIKIQFHWQRGESSHSRLTHPSPDGHGGAPGDDRAGTWVRVATPLAPVAGSNWGSNALPRVGQEVLVDFLEGNIDRPVVIGALYNGRGQPDAQHNQVAQGAGAGAATGNAPTWFPGESGAHAHPAVLSGIKTQSLAASQGGTGAYNQLVFDDSPGQPRVVLQRHGALHDGSAELNLGHLRHQSDNQRLSPAAFGAELKSEHSAALRAGQGLLLSGDARGAGAGDQLDVREAIAQIEQSHEMQLNLASLAQKHRAGIKTEPEAEQLPALMRLVNSIEVLESKDGGDGTANDDEPNLATGYSEPQLELSSPDGIVGTTPADAIFVSRKTSNLSADHDVNFASQGNGFFANRSGISLFTYGKASASEKPNKEIGISLHAASGKVSAQSQSEATMIMADKAVTVASVMKGVMVRADKHVLLNAQGAQLNLKGGNIELYAPGKVEFKASLKELAGPQGTGDGVSLPMLSELKDCAQKISAAAGEGGAIVTL
ncbi:type VI secretion system Vgr family protein [Massilia sp. YIM B02443]|uniref:type VI secretion system Vgr family protein n=1 Tax=Massilia sp. YIM B02443 TaxID=3050127 RepID=UPI0025B62F34|nr:type VI secretion system Vgr family protein [Massilia sp. YIM B02443]MDN4036421.1 type VI secretion system tip protein TssI/VgrG [Massilia sp. YIM B02443]